MAANRRSFIIRIWQTEDGQLRGQISDPLDGWRRPFADAAELWRLLGREPPQNPRPPTDDRNPNSLASSP